MLFYSGGLGHVMAPVNTTIHGGRVKLGEGKHRGVEVFICIRQCYRYRLLATNFV